MQPLGQLLRNVIAQRIGDDDKRSRILPAHMFRVEPFLTRHNRQRGFQRLPRQQCRPADAQRRKVAVFIQPFRRLHRRLQLVLQREQPQRQRLIRRRAHMAIRRVHPIQARSIRREHLLRVGEVEALSISAGKQLHVAQRPQYIRIRRIQPPPRQFPPRLHHLLHLIDIHAVLRKRRQHRANQQRIHAGVDRYAHQLRTLKPLQPRRDGITFLHRVAGFQQGFSVRMQPFGEQRIRLLRVIRRARQTRERILRRVEPSRARQQVAGKLPRVPLTGIAERPFNQQPERILPAEFSNGFQLLVFFLAHAKHHRADHIRKRRAFQPAEHAHHADFQLLLGAVIALERTQLRHALTAGEKTPHTLRIAAGFHAVGDMQFFKEQRPVIRSEFLAVFEHIRQPVILPALKLPRAVEQNILLRVIALDLPPQGEPLVLPHDEDAHIGQLHLLHVGGETALIILEHDDAPRIVFRKGRGKTPQQFLPYIHRLPLRHLILPSIAPSLA